MQTIVLPLKDYRESIPVSVDFSDLMQFGESITGASVVASLFSGTDNTPQNIISGAPTYTQTVVTQLVINGVAGNIYTLAFLITGSASHNYVKVGQLSVINANAPY